MEIIIPRSQLQHLRPQETFTIVQVAERFTGRPGTRVQVSSPPGVRVLLLDGPEIHKEKAQWERLEFGIDPYGSELPPCHPTGVSGFIPGDGKKGADS